MSAEIKFLDKVNCYWMLKGELATLDLKSLLIEEFKFTYFLGYQLVYPYDEMKVKDEGLFQGDLQLSNCYTDLVFETSELLSHNIDNLIKRPVNLLQTNVKLPEYIDFVNKDTNLAISLLTKNKLDWGIYTELSVYNRDTEIMASSAELLKKINGRV